MTESPAATAVQEPNIGVSEPQLGGATVGREVVAEAIAVIDKALAEMLRRELVSSVEVGDLLLDLRSLLTSNA
jgi:hypothetical protein